MTTTEPFDIEEVRAMSSAQLGEFLGFVFGLRPGMRLVVERDICGEVLMLVEAVSSRTHPAAVCSDLQTAFYRGGTVLSRVAGT
jgi:hypothetical protein